MITINGKAYPLWSQFVEQKGRWIGGILEELDSHDSMDKALGIDKGGTTKITDISLSPNDEENAYFEVIGEDFGCGFATDIGGIDSSISEDGWIGFCGYGGHQWRIKEKDA